MSDVYITKWCMDQVIKRCKVLQPPDRYGYILVVSAYTAAYGTPIPWSVEPGKWFPTEAEALADAERQRGEKIARYERLIAKAKKRNSGSSMSELRSDQIADLALLMNDPMKMHLSDPGTGKTPTVCVYQNYLWHEHHTPSVWPMPKSLLKKNHDEALLWGGWQDDEVVILDGPWESAPKGAKVYLMGFDRFGMQQEKFPPEFQAIQIDEFHKGFGGHASARTQALYHFMDRQGKFFTPMTGTLIAGKLETAYPALQVIEPRYYGTFESFKNFHTT